MPDFPPPLPPGVPPTVPPGWPPQSLPFPPQDWLDHRRRHVELIEELRRPFYWACHLRILVVADNFLHFGPEDFGLSELVATLRGMSTWRYPVTVDLAHRADPGAAALAGGTPDFRFSASTLAPYDQVWLFGSDYPSRDAPPNDPGAIPPLSDPERLALTAFMDAGGGVFATGDHEDLGVTLGGYLPRVRSMRQWFFPDPGPQGEPVAPHGGDATRHDTNRPGHDGVWSFDDQSDDVPQEIRPHWFGRGLVRSVHPLLCTPEGPIRVLPDHAHEGRCVLPADLHATYAIGATSFREYPDGPDGQPVAPVIVATATMLAGAQTSGKPPVPGGEFGVIGAWDGHRTGTHGRIVVDATWHHFININLVGVDALAGRVPPHPKALGFLATPSGQAHYERIKAYFRNIADWLTPRSARRCRLHRHLWWLSRHGAIREGLSVHDLGASGQLVREWLRRLGPCDRLGLIEDLGVRLPPLLRPLFDPWAPWPEKMPEWLGTDDRLTQDFADELAAHLLGGAMLAVMRLNLSPEKAFGKRGKKLKLEEPGHLEVKALGVAVDEGAQAGLEAFAQRWKARASGAKGIAAALG